MCSHACGTELRRKQAKARRDADLEGFRADERERQATCRRNRALRAGRVEDVPAATRAPPREQSGRGVSRADWSSQVMEITSKTVERMAREAAVSRADWARQVARIARESGAIRGGAGA